MEAIKDTMESIGNTVAPALSSSMSELAESIMKEFDGVASGAETLGQTWGRVAEGITGKWQTVVDWWQTNFGAGGVWSGIMDMASGIMESQWGPGGTWEGNINNLKKIGQLLIDRWNEQWGEGGTWAGIMEMATNIITTQWGEGGTWAGILENAKTIITKLQIRWFEELNKMQSKILEIKDVVERFKDALSNLWDWLKDKVFKFEVNIPSIPDWAVPGSPIPLHTAWKDFGRFLDQETFEPNMGFDAMQPPLMGNALGVLGAAGGTNTNNTNIPMTNNIYSSMDEKMLEAKIRRILKQEYRNRKV
jgi:hypothetical protein